MEKCTKFMGTVVLILTLVLLITVIPTDREGAIYDDTLRLHILARSDGDEDQALKLAVRDKLLAKYGALLSRAESREDATEAVRELESEIERDVDGWIAEAGYDYRSSVEIGTEWYERRSYDGFTLPEGYYTSLIVRLGEGDGRNWWCVMYPPLCLDIATEDAHADDALLDYTDEEITLITGKRYTVKFKLLEIISRTFK